MAGGLRAWSLSRDSLTRLLEQLHPEPRQAAYQYERVRSKLTKLFQWRGCRFAEDLADETIDRVARKIEGGIEIQSEDPYRYFCSVAFFVFKEVMAEQRREETAFESPLFKSQQASTLAVEESSVPMMPCLDSCLEGMAPRARDLILEYHRVKRESGSITGIDLLKSSVCR